MSYISPRSLKLLEDIVNEDISNHGQNGDDGLDDLYGNSLQIDEDEAARQAEAMNETAEENFSKTLNFFEKLERENGPVNGHVENGVREDTLQGIAEESEEDSYTVSETTIDTTTVDNDTSASSVTKTKKRVSRRSVKNNQPRKPKKTSSLREGSTDRESINEQTETMSDSGHRRGRHRKLKKREQMQTFRALQIEPLESAEEKLEQKYNELQHLMMGQFADQKVALSQNHLKQMELLRQQYAIASHGLPPSGVLVPRSMPAYYRQNGFSRHDGYNKENVRHATSDDEAYGTIRTLQATKSGQRARVQSARTRPLSAPRRNQSRSTSRERKPRNQSRSTSRERKNRNPVRTASKENDREGGDSNSDQKERGRKKDEAKDAAHSPRSRSSSGSPRRMLTATETHLKNTDNEFVRDWLRKKEMDIRRQKIGERKKKRQERKEKILKENERREKFKDSGKIVKEWEREKRREAMKRQREERRQRKEEAALIAQERAKRVNALHGWRVGHPLSAPAPVVTERSKLRISRPGTTMEEVQRQQEEQEDGNPEDGGVMSERTEGNQEEVVEGPQPPVTKYVYRRPVLGKVRLRMKGQQQQDKEQSKPVQVKKVVEKPLSKEELEKKQRMSYDDWLQRKRKDDQKKKKDAERQKQLARSEPEYERVIPELVQSGEENVLRGRKIEKPAEQEIEAEVLKSYGRSESPEEHLDRVAKNVVSYVLRSLSDEESDEDLFEHDEDAESKDLRVSGSKAALSRRVRPASALAIPSPQTSKSPRRPMSAQPKPKPVSREVIEGSLPFPSDIGAPPHVERIQKKLFSSKMWVNPEDEVRPEPQGSDAQDNQWVTDGQREDQDENRNAADAYEDATLDSNVVDKLGDESNGSSSFVKMSNKRVSFCEETTVFDEEGSEVEEEVEEAVASDEEIAMSLR